MPNRADYAFLYGWTDNRGHRHFQAVKFVEKFGWLCDEPTGLHRRRYCKYIEAIDTNLNIRQEDY